MPLYFAYGSNMDEVALRSRCPRARAMGPARLARHRFSIMGNGYATIRRQPGSDVHGVLFDLALSDIPALDRYEEVSRGLYRKVLQPLVRTGGGTCTALLYIGSDETEGVPAPVYMEAIVDAAQRSGLPTSYLVMLRSHLPGRTGVAFMRGTANPS